MRVCCVFLLKKPIDDRFFDPLLHTRQGRPRHGNACSPAKTLFARCSDAVEFSRSIYRSIYV